MTINLHDQAPDYVDRILKKLNPSYFRSEYLALSNFTPANFETLKNFLLYSEHEHLKLEDLKKLINKIDENTYKETSLNATELEQLKSVCPQLKINTDFPAISDHTPLETWNTEADFSRIFDQLPLEIDDFPQEAMTEFFKTIESKGIEFALSQLINPLLDQVIDFETKQLKKSFIKNNLSQDLFNSEAEKRQKTSEEFSKILAQSFFASLSYTMLSAYIFKFHKKFEHYLLPLGTFSAYILDKHQASGIQLFDENPINICQDFANEISTIARELNIQDFIISNHDGPLYQHPLIKNIPFIQLWNCFNLTYRHDSNYAEFIQKADQIIQKFSLKYVHDLLRKITPDMFSLESNPESLALQSGNFSRIFDVIATQPNMIIDSVITDRYISNALNYGFAYADAQALNPLITAIIDTKQGKLHDDFIAKHIGRTNYQSIVSKLHDKDIKNPDLHIARGFFNAFYNYFTTATKDLKRSPLGKIIAVHQNYSDSIGYQIETDQKIKLHDGTKYHICKLMSEDIKNLISYYDSNNSDLRDSSLMYQYNIVFLNELSFLMKWKNQASLKLKDPNLPPAETKVLRQKIKDADKILTKYALMQEKIDTLKQYRQEILTNDQYNEKIEDINNRIKESNDDYQKSQKQRVYTIISLLITVMVLVAIASATFGVGLIPFIPFIPGIISLGLSSTIGIFFVGFFGKKYKTNLQKFSDFENEIEASSASSAENLSSHFQETETLLTEALGSSSSTPKAPSLSTTNIPSQLPKVKQEGINKEEEEEEGERRSPPPP